MISCLIYNARGIAILPVNHRRRDRCHTNSHSNETAVHSVNREAFGGSQDPLELT
jgi:hypothetical protein